MAQPTTDAVWLEQAFKGPWTDAVAGKAAQEATLGQTPPPIGYMIPMAGQQPKQVVVEGVTIGAWYIATRQGQGVEAPAGCEEITRAEYDALTAPPPVEDPPPEEGEGE